MTLASAHGSVDEPGAVPADTSSPFERPLRPVLDARDLPSVVFGSRVVTWWGTVAFMVAETTTIAATLTAYYYVRRGYTSWPPLRTPLPDLLLPTISLVVLVAALVPCYLFAKAARMLDTKRMERWLWLAVIMMSVAVVLRFLEFSSLNVRWDANTYASVTWAIVFLHFTLLLVDTLETLIFAVMVTRGALQDRYYPGIDEDAFYSYFMVAAWVPCYVTVYLVPRWV
jgi:heme/copper-type cytochrome/quinol oxidase subunit 3